MKKSSMKILAIASVVAMGATRVYASVSQSGFPRATADNLVSFQLPTVQLTSEEAQATEAANKAEADADEMRNMVERAYNFGDFFPAAESGDEVQVEIYQKSSQVGKQFLLVRHNGKIRYVFAITAGKSSGMTPGGEFGVQSQAWRHMSTKYPGNGENNMDHATYFRAPVAFHSTTFGNYSLLSNRGSHGCVRMARPEARAVYTLIKRNLSTTSIKSFSTGEPPEEDLDLIRTQLAKDLNFISYMITSHNKGDVPFKKDSDYFKYLEDPSAFPNVDGSKILEVPVDMDLGPGEKTPLQLDT